MDHEETAPVPLAQRPLSRRTVLIGAAALGAAVVLSGESASAASSRKVKFAKNGQANCTIYIGDTEGAVVQQAASELSTLLQQITGGVFTVVSAATAPTGSNIIAVGRNNPVAAGAGIDFTALGGDGFALRNTGTQTVIAGAEPRGTLYGVYWVLDHLMGVRWFSPTHTSVPNSPGLTIPAAQLNGDHVPRYTYRQMLYMDAWDPAYRQHNMLNGARGQMPAGIPAGIDTWSTYWPKDSFGQTFHTFVPDQTLWAGGQLAAMNPLTRSTAAANIVTAMQQPGDDHTWGFVQNDANWIPDPASQTFANSHGGALSAPLLDMTNDVLQRVRQQVPDARLAMQAYWFSLKAPTGITPAPGVVITVAPLFADFGHNLFGQENADQAQELSAWCTMAPDIVFWNYLCSYAQYLLPFPNYFSMSETVQDFASQGQNLGYMGQGAYNTAGAELAHLRVWVTARLLWDPSLDATALVEEFCLGHYGAAGPHIYQYLVDLVAGYETSGERLGFITDTTSGIYSWSVMKQADDHFANAAAAVAGDADLTKRVRAARLGVDYLVLLRRVEYQAAATAAGVTWNIDLANRLTRFDLAVDESGLVSGDELGTLTPIELKKRVRIERNPATPPALVSGLPSDEWADYQDERMRLYAPVTDVVVDPAASDKLAVETPGSVGQWGVQFELKQLPAAGLWKLYASVRIDEGTAAGTANALEMGVYPVTETASTSTVSELSDGEYHELPFPGVFQRATDTAFLYISTLGVPGMGNVYVDRIFAIKV